MISNRRVLALTLLLSALAMPAAGEEVTDAIRAYLQRVVEAKSINAGIVVGLVDEQGSRVVGYGKSDDGRKSTFDGETLFEIGSNTKTFTAILLEDMVRRGEMKLDDPVAKYLPSSVTMPTHRGKQITLRHLATHMSGLPLIPDNLDCVRADNPYAQYTVEKMYAFLSGYQLTRDPGAQGEYSNLGMGLLGHVIALKAGTSYEALLVERICRPLGMESTRITLPLELQARLVVPHNEFGDPVPSWDLPALGGAGGVRSTANDLLKYVSANLGLTQGSFTPAIEATQEMGGIWSVTSDPYGSQIISYSGGTGGCAAWIAFDKARRRGAVVLTNARRMIEGDNLYGVLIASEWQPGPRPKGVKIKDDDIAYVGQYRRSADSTTRLLAHKPLVYISVGGILAALAILYLTRGFRKRASMLSYAVLVVATVAAVMLFGPDSAKSVPQPGIGIRCEGDRLFVQENNSPAVLLPPGESELVPEREMRFFERLSGLSITFSRDAQGGTTLTIACHGRTWTYEKLSAEPPLAPARALRRAVVELDAELLDACVGQYEFPASAMSPQGLKLKIWREGSHLVGQAWGERILQGAFDLYSESELRFFTKITKSQLTFIKNGQGDVVRVVLHDDTGMSHEGTRRSAD